MTQALRARLARAHALSFGHVRPSNSGTYPRTQRPLRPRVPERGQHRRHRSRGASRAARCRRGAAGGEEFHRGDQERGPWAWKSPRVSLRDRPSSKWCTRSWCASWASRARASTCGRNGRWSSCSRGLQGAGKTTTVGKLARWLMEKQRKKVLMVSTDVYRPAAIAQLRPSPRRWAPGSRPPMRARRRSRSHAARSTEATLQAYDVLLSIRPDACTSMRR